MFARASEGVGECLVPAVGRDAAAVPSQATPLHGAMRWQSEFKRQRLNVKSYMQKLVFVYRKRYQILEPNRFQFFGGGAYNLEPNRYQFLEPNRY